jgi:hypothetical protein
LTLYFTLKAEHDRPRRIREFGDAVIPDAVIFFLTGDLSSVLSSVGVTELLKKLLEYQRER